MKIQHIITSAILLAGLALPAMAEDVVEVSTTLAMNRATKKVTPAYPPIAMQLKLKGELMVDIVVNAQGEVEDAKVAKGNAIFSQNAITAVKQWKFQPLEKEGKPVKMATTIAFNFSN